MSAVVSRRSRRVRGLFAWTAVGLSVVLVVASAPAALRAADPTPTASQAPSTPGPQPAPGGALVAPDQSITAAATTGGDGLLGRYYPNTTWSGTPSLERVDPTIDFDWSGAHPINASDFSVAWSGSLLVEVAGTYTFALYSDDGSTLSLDGTLVVDNGGAHPPQQVSNTVGLTAGLHDVSLRYFECCGGPALVHLYWTPPGGTGLVVVPQAVLFSGSGPSVEQTYGTGSGLHGPSTTNKEAEPVDTATGNYVTTVTDLALPGRGLGFAFTRTYNSLDTAVGPLGQGWRHGYAARIILEASGAARFVAEDGAQYLFASDGAGGFSAPAGATSRLRAVTGGYELTRRDQVRYRFDSGGQLIAETDRNGNTIGFTYTGGSLTTITDTVGRVIALGYDPSNRLISLADPAGRTVAYTYDASGRLASVTDVRGGLTRYGYDAAGRLATITDQIGHVLVTNTYGADGRVAEQLDGRGNRSTFAWDPATGTSTFTDARGGRWLDVYESNKLVRQTDPLGNPTSYTYDASFNRTGVTDPRGNTTTMTYDAAGNLLTQTAPAPLSYVETFTYDAANNLLTYTDGRGFTTTNTYDAAGNLTRITYADSTFTTLTYDSTGLPLSVADQRAKTTSFAYDAQANRVRVTSPLGAVTTMTYDPAGRMTSLVEPRGNVAGADPTLYTSTFTYDAAGNLLSGTDPLGNLTTTAYDPAGNRTSVTNALGRITRYGYDAANSLTSVTDAASGITAYAYDATENLVSRTDANAHVTAYEYDLAGRLTRTTDPAAHVWTVAYDPAGALATRTDANGATTSYAYDALDRLTGISFANPSTATVTFAYDANGNRTTMTDGAGTETYAYDALGRLTSVTRGTDTFGYGYDVAGNLTSRTYPDGTLTSYSYDDDGRLVTAVSAGFTTSYTYDVAGNPRTAATPDGFTARSSFDRAGRLAEVAHVGAAGVLSRFTYALDPAGNRVKMTTTRGTMAYTYDALDRLTRVDYSGATGSGGGGGTTQSATTNGAGLDCLDCGGGSTINGPPTDNPPSPTDTFAVWTYDPVGNRLTQTSYLGTTAYAYDAADRLTSVTGPGTSPTITYAYDANGNQTVAGPSSFAYDLADRLVAATVGTKTETYTWAGDGVRLSATSGNGPSATTRFLVDRSFALPTVAIERDGNGKLLRRYTYGLDLLSQTTPTKGPYWYHHDGLGSVSDVTSNSGTSLWWTEYTPFGAPRASASTSQSPTNLFRFTGAYLDSVAGLYHLRARQYDPTSGRFLSTDPVSPAISDPYVGSYVYVGNNPVRFTDPSGRCLGPLIFLLPACIGFAAGVSGYIAGNTAVNVVDNLASGLSPVDDLSRGLDPGDAAISGFAGVLGGPVTSIGAVFTRVAAGAAVGCATTFASQAIGGRTKDLLETGVGCWAGAESSVLPLGNLSSALFGTIVAISQAVATYVGQSGK